MARLYAKYSRFDLAEAHYRLALKYDPFSPRARIGLAKAVCDQGRFWEGVQEYEKVGDPGNLQALLLGNYEATLKALIMQYQRLLKDDPNNARLHYSLGLAYSKAGRIDDAAQAYGRGIALEPDFKQALFNLASTCEALGDLPKAAYYYQLIATSQGDPDELDALAQKKYQEIMQKLGASQGAMQYNRPKL